MFWSGILGHLVDLDSGETARLFSKEIVAFNIPASNL